MKDLHCHLLYGIDDGCKTIDESVNLIKKMSNAGIREMIVTPHYIESSKYNCNNRQKKTLLTKLKNRLKKENIDVTLYLGNEVFYTDKFVELLKNKEIYPLNGSRYVLFEFPMHNNYHGSGSVISYLISKGYVPVLAHPKSLELLKLHPTVKPVGLLHEIILDCSSIGDIVLDIFGGFP